MAKELSEMSLEELWELFPIFLVEHNDRWNLLYEEIPAPRIPRNHFLYFGFRSIFCRLYDIRSNSITPISL